MRGAPIGVPFTPSSLPGSKLRAQTEETTAGVLLVYASGSEPDRWPDGRAKFIPAGSDLVFQMQYRPEGTAGTDQSSFEMRFANEVPKQRVLTIPLIKEASTISLDRDDDRIVAWGTIPTDAILLNFYPNMHFRGKMVACNIVHTDGSVEALLHVTYHWQVTYQLAEPKFLKAGTRLQAVEWYDNPPDKTRSSDPKGSMARGDRTYGGMMAGYFDVAVPANVEPRGASFRMPAVSNTGQKHQRHETIEVGASAL